MMGLDDIRKDINLINMIDWEMGPEEAVTLYLEWGNNWSHGKKMVKSKNDVSYYFIVNTWEETPVIFLVRRNSEEAVDLASFEMPDALRDQFLEKIGHNRGVYALTEEIKAWLEEELEAPVYHAEG